MLVFVSHQNNDRDIQCSDLVTQAIGQLNQTVRVMNEYDIIRYFVDTESLRPGDQLDVVIETNLQNADLLIVIMSCAALQSKWVAHEVTRFQELHPGAPLIPVFAQDCHKSDDWNGLLALLMGQGHERVAIYGGTEADTYLAASDTVIWQKMHGMVGFCLRTSYDPQTGDLDQWLNTNWYGESLK